MLHFALLAGWLAVAAPQVEVRALDGQVYRGELAAFSATQVDLQTSDGKKSLRLADVLTLAPRTAPRFFGESPKAWIELTDGSRLSGRDYAVAGKSAALKLADGELPLPPRGVRLVRFSAPDAKLDALWSEALKTPPAGDLLVVRKKDTLDFLEGVVGNVTADKVSFELDKEPLEVKRDRVDGIIYAAAKRELPEAVGMYEGADGWRLLLRSAALDADQWKFETPSGVKVSVAGDRLVRLDFSTGKIRFLSDLEPESSQTVPFFDFGRDVTALSAFSQPRRDRAFASDVLKLGGKTYAKGLCIKSKTTLVYRVPTGMKTFAAMAGIDDSMQGAGHVRLAISADNKVLFDKPVAGSDRPTPLTLDIAGAVRLKIVVDYGEDQDVGDHLDLCDARMQK